MANLEFQPFQDGFSINSTNTQGFSGNIGDENRLVTDASDVSASGRKSNLFSFKFYQQFFDVETDQVLKRVLNSALPTNSNFILDVIHPMPDLWGPFWISVTLVFSIGVFGNIAQYIENEGSSGEYNSDFRLVTSSATLIFLYILGVPVILSTIMWQRKSEMQYAVSDLLCAYGYSLSIFIPVSILWTLDVNWFRWLLILAAVSLSGAVLVRALWPAFKTDPNKMVAYGTIFGVILLHFLLALTFKVYFFDATHPHSEKAPILSKKPLDSSSNGSNSLVLATDKVQELLKTNLPTSAKDAETKAAIANISRSNEVKQSSKVEAKAQSVQQSATVAPVTNKNST